MTDNKNISPSLSLTTIYGDGSSSTSRFTLTVSELSTMKIIYENVMLKKCTDIFIESKLYKSLMNRNLVIFSQTYRNVILTDVSRVAIESKKSSGKVKLEDIDDEKLIVEWREF